LKKKSIILISGIVVLFAGAAASGYLLFLQPQSDLSEPEKIVVIPAGSSISQIAAILVENKAIHNENLFTLAARIGGYDTQLKAGKFSIPSGTNNRDILELLSSGRQMHEKITIPEGVTSRRIASLLSRQVDIDSTEFMRLVSDSTFVEESGIEANSLEGYLFPETYYFPWGVTAREAIAFMLEQFRRHLPDSAWQKAQRLGLSLHESITLASIIEGEAMLDSERRRISAVYHNRLRKGMKLQADPTIQYIIPDGPRRLLNADLEFDSPYNTYLYAGLPPGPINNPGQKSIEAALDPEETPFLYMVAKGDGSHVFSITLAEHNKAHREFNRLRKQVARRKKQNAKDGGNAKE
jgi:UPF0755 protein